MAVVNDVPQLVDKKGGSYAAIAPKLEPGKFNKWKKRMLCYLEGMEPYYIKYDIMESVISCVLAKETWTDLVHIFKGPLDTKENRIMDLKLEYQTFRAKFTESISQTYTRYKTLLNELAKDGVNLSKHEINTLDLADIYGRFIYKENLIQRSFDDEVDKRSTKEYLRDLDIEYHERALLENSKHFIKRRNNFSNLNSQADPKFQKDYKAEYKKMKSKLALLEASPSKVSDEEDVTQVKVLMALADDELNVRKSHARNGDWVGITIRKVNTLISMDEDADWQNYL
ncbi:hypothetical protein Tco_0639916, partial [Tanacetum coccineum]